MNKLTDFAKQAGDMAQDLAKQAGEMAKTAGEKAGDMIEVTKIKSEIRDEEKKIANLKGNIGEVIVKLVAEGADAPSEVQVMCADIEAALKVIEEKKALMESLGTSDEAVVEEAVYQAMAEIDKEDEMAKELSNEAGEVTISKTAAEKIAKMDAELAKEAAEVEAEVEVEAVIEDIVEEAVEVIEVTEKPNFAAEMSFTTKKDEE